MDRMAIKSFADAAREHVTIELWLNETPLGHVHLEASDAEDYIHDLAKHRAALREEVTPMLDPGARLEPIVDPAWHVSAQKGGGHALALRHPGFGWLSFVLSDEEAREIAMALRKEASSASK